MGRLIKSLPLSVTTWRWIHLPEWRIYASINFVSSGSENGLSPICRHAITWTNAHVLSMRPLETILSEIRIKMQNFSFMKMYLYMSAAKWLPFSPWFFVRSATCSNLNSWDLLQPCSALLMGIPRNAVSTLVVLKHKCKQCFNFAPVVYIELL